MATRHRPLLVTHSGTFHLDGAFAYAVLRTGARARRGGPRPRAASHARRSGDRPGGRGVGRGRGLRRSGGALRPDQRGAPVREDGLPHSAGYGLAPLRRGGRPGAARRLCGQQPRRGGRLGDRPGGRAPHRRDRQRVGPPGDALGMASLVEDGNPSWDSPASAIKPRRTRRSSERPTWRRLPPAPGRDRAGAPRRRGRGARRARPFGRPARARTRPQAGLGGAGPIARAAGALRRVPGAQRQLDGGRDAAGAGLLRPAPPAAGGVGRAARRRPRRGCGVPDAVFVHARRFVGAARSREGAMAMARGAIEIGSKGLASRR